MKKLFFLALLSMLISCEKDSGCKTCTTKTTCTGGYTTSATFEACGQDLKEIDGKTIKSTASSGGVTVTCTAKTTCR
jgi:hypothetical protein